MNKALIKETLRMVICLTGLSLVSILVADILKEWQLINKNLSPVWITIPIISLFIAKEIIHSSYIKDSQKLSQKTIQAFNKIIEIILLIISVLVIVSSVFVWFGAIETTIRSAG